MDMARAVPVSRSSAREMKGKDISMHELRSRKYPEDCAEARRNEQCPEGDGHSLAGWQLSDLEDDWIQRYFDYLSKGTLRRGQAQNRTDTHYGAV